MRRYDTFAEEETTTRISYAKLPLDVLTTRLVIGVLNVYRIVSYDSIDLLEINEGLKSCLFVFVKFEVASVRTMSRIGECRTCAAHVF